MDNIIKMYKDYGDAGYIGEEVTQYQHAMQCYLNADQFLKKMMVVLILKILLHTK